MRCNLKSRSHFQKWPDCRVVQHYLCKRPIPKADTLALGKILKPSLKASEKHFVSQTLANIRNRKHNVRTQRSRMGINIHRNTCRILFRMEPSNTYTVKPGGCLWH